MVVLSYAPRVFCSLGREKVNELQTDVQQIDKNFLIHGFWPVGTRFEHAGGKSYKKNSCRIAWVLAVPGKPAASHIGSKNKMP